MSTIATSINYSTHRNYESSNYLLPCDEAEQERLNLQHRIIIKAFNGKLFVAPVSLKEGDHVLESGAGTGTWMLQFAAQVPSTIQIQGIDIGSRLFPTIYPPNIHFSIHSVTSLPERWTSSFAFVHQRLLMGALTKDMWKAAISEISRILVPGGWAEFVEAKPSFPQAGTSSTKMAMFLLDMMRDKNLLVDCQTYIPIMLREAGLVNINCEYRNLPLGRSAGQDGIDGSTNFAGVFSGLRTSMLEAGGYGYVRSEEEFDQLIMNTKEEWLASDSNLLFYAIYAQKPL